MLYVYIYIYIINIMELQGEFHAFRHVFGHLTGRLRNFPRSSRDKVSFTDWDNPIILRKIEYSVE